MLGSRGEGGGEAARPLPRLLGLRSLSLATWRYSQPECLLHLALDAVVAHSIPIGPTVPEMLPVCLSLLLLVSCCFSLSFQC